MERLQDLSTSFHHVASAGVLDRELHAVPDGHCGGPPGRDVCGHRAVRGAAPHPPGRVWPLLPHRGRRRRWSLTRSQKQTFYPLSDKNLQISFFSSHKQAGSVIQFMSGMHGEVCFVASMQIKLRLMLMMQPAPPACVPFLITSLFSYESLEF